jgi:antitoxin component of MazEF toxin-antitoxin module
MVKSLIKHGNSLALLIEKPILELLGVNPETQFDITTDGQALIITPIKDPKRHPKFASALNKVNTKYSKALKKLAE